MVIRKNLIRRVIEGSFTLQCSFCRYTEDIYVCIHPLCSQTRAKYYGVHSLCTDGDGDAAF